MRIWKNELFKVVSRPVFVFLFALLVAVNAVLIGTASPGSYPRDAYKRAQAAVQQMPEPQGIAWIQERFTALAVLTELQDGALSPEEIVARWGMEGEELQRYSTGYQRGGVPRLHRRSVCRILSLSGAVGLRGATLLLPRLP